MPYDEIGKLHGTSIPAPRKRGHAFIGEGPINADGKHKAKLRPKEKTKQKSKQKVSQGTTKNSERKRNAQLARAQKAKQRSAWMRHLRELHELCKDDKPAPRCWEA